MRTALINEMGWLFFLRGDMAEFSGARTKTMEKSQIDYERERAIVVRMLFFFS